MLYDPLFLLIACALVTMTGISKAGFGAGVEMAVVPIMALFILPATAAAIMLPILLAIDAANLVRYRRDWNRTIVFTLVAAAFFGVLLGAYSFRALDPDLLRLALGVLALLFVVQRLVAGALHRLPTKPGGVFTFVFGAMAGFTSFVAHAGGPPAKIVLIRHGLDKRAFVGTNGYLFAFINILKLGPYLALGQITTETLTGSLALAPLIPVGVLLGFWFNKRISETAFTVVIFSALALTGLKLIWDGVAAFV
ncbi:MAG: sulfite exporter TauE/SafE family protein [Pseudomonadota bacterium]